MSLDSLYTAPVSPAVTSSGGSIVLTPGSVYPQSTFANLPAASANSGNIYLVTDVGINGSYWKSDGTNWKLMFSVPLLSVTSASNNITGTTTETIFTGASITPPANVLAFNKLRFDAQFSYTGNTNSKTMRIWVGGTSFVNIADTTAGDTNARITGMLHNRGNTNAQIASSSITASAQVGGIVSASGTENIATGLLIKITGMLGVSTDTITLQGALVELVPGN